MKNMRNLRKIEMELKVSVVGYWNFLDEIPLINATGHPAEDPNRIKEEISAFNVWKKFNQSIPFENLRYVKGGKFLVDVDCIKLFERKCLDQFEKISVSILCPKAYPRALPKLADDPNHIGDMILRKAIDAETNGAPFMCIPPILKAIWTKNVPHAGIAHYLNIFLIWFSTVSTKKNRTIQRFGRNISIIGIQRES